MKLKPLGNRVIVKRHEEKEVTDGGIVIPTQAAERPLKGDVLAVGPGKYLDNGELIPPGVEVGDVVVFGKLAGEEIEVDDEKVTVMDGDAVLAIDLDG